MVEILAPLWALGTRPKQYGCIVYVQDINGAEEIKGGTIECYWYLGNFWTVVLRSAGLAGSPTGRVEGCLGG